MSVLPLSLSPQICILPSGDLADLLAASSLPPLPHILQSFSPLPQVTTRTTALVSVSHSSFALRFADLAEIEAACREDEEQRAARMMDWIAARIHKRSPKWVDDVEKLPEKDDLRTPWWDELRRCIEGDQVPSKFEAWNHPVALILAVSTTAPNPLQAITNLYTRLLDLPQWVDRNILRYTLIIHPQNSPLSDEEAGALFNAVKRQYGLHSYLLSLSMPVPPPPPVPVPALIPRLPPPPPPESSANPADIEFTDGRNTLRMSEGDIHQTARFTREFVVMSLLPWMEKCVNDWNENFSSTRRLPSRLFSSTRRLFGSPASSPSVSHNPSSSISSLSSRTPPPPDGGQGGLGAGPPSQLRRLAEFATILGDLKLAVSVWETLRKEGKGGSDILPLLLSPSVTLPLHASNALTNINITSEPRASEQLLALKYAVRWEVGISHTDFVTDPLEGERWLVWAAGNAEEATSALLLAHAALLSARKQAKRKAALWYLTAANRLEKCGIKPLTMYLLRRAHGLYHARPEKSLSPSFWESEGKASSDIQAFDIVMAGIEHPLGRLLYTTGDTAGAVRCFLGLLRGSSGRSSGLQIRPSVATPSTDALKSSVTDKVFLDDFRVAFSHLKSTSDEGAQLPELNLPFTFCMKRYTSVRIAKDSGSGAATSAWETREDAWKSYWKSCGHKEALMPCGQAYVDETFWVDLVLHNPLEVEVNLSNLTVVAQEMNSSDASASPGFVEIESIEDIILGAKESQTISIRVKSSRAVSVIFTRVTYDFLSLLPSSESLASRGRRLHDTPAQRQKPTYAPDVIVKAEVVEVNHRLSVDFVEDERLVLAEGEMKSRRLWLSNVGSLPINEVWMVSGTDDVIWVGPEKETHNADSLEAFETVRSKNSLAPPNPRRVLFSSDGSPSLEPGASLEIPAILYVDSAGERELRLLFVYRENDTDAFQSTRLTLSYEVYGLFNMSIAARPSQSLDYMFLVTLELNSICAENIQLTQITSLSAAWKSTLVSPHNSGSFVPNQSSHLLVGVNRRSDADSDMQQTLDFVSSKLEGVILGRTLELSPPPTLNLLCTYMLEPVERFTKKESTWHLLFREMRNNASRVISSSHPYIPSQSLPHIFPLHNPASLDFIISWTIPSQERVGHIFLPGPALGASHAMIEDTIDKAENMKAKRSIYAETQREKAEIIQAIRQSEWNAETNPITLLLQKLEMVRHDFRQGPCRIPITLTIRNFSSTHQSRFILGLCPDPALSSALSNTLSPPYVGQLTFRGILDPAASRTFRPTLWVTRPGTYHVGRWYLEVEVLEPPSPSHDGVRVRHQYRHEQSPNENQSFAVCALEPS